MDGVPSRHPVHLGQDPVGPRTSLDEIRTAYLDVPDGLKDRPQV